MNGEEHITGPDASPGAVALPPTATAPRQPAAASCVCRSEQGIPGCSAVRALTCPACLVTKEAPDNLEECANLAILAEHVSPGGRCGFERPGRRREGRGPSGMAALPRDRRSPGRTPCRDRRSPRLASRPGRSTAWHPLGRDWCSSMPSPAGCATSSARPARMAGSGCWPSPRPRRCSARPPAGTCWSRVPLMSSPGTTPRTRRPRSWPGLRRWADVDRLAGSPVVRDVLAGTARPGGRWSGRWSRWPAFADVSVLVTGESGTGKELVARLIHTLDPRPGKRDLVLLDCTTVVPSLSGSEFFGHERGAFTGAVGARDGAFAMADGGTLFLDEVGELPLGLQAELLRVVQEGTYKRVGGNTWRRTRFRLICATNRDLAAEETRGAFRRDFYYRIAAWRCHLPSLRERSAGHPPAGRHFLEPAPARRDAVEFDRPVQRAAAQPRLSGQRPRAAPAHRPHRPPARRSRSDHGRGRPPGGAAARPRPAPPGRATALEQCGAPGAGRGRRAEGDRPHRPGHGDPHRPARCRRATCSGRHASSGSPTGRCSSVGPRPAVPDGRQRQAEVMAARGAVPLRRTHATD